MSTKTKTKIFSIFLVMVIAICVALYFALPKPFNKIPSSILVLIFTGDAIFFLRGGEKEWGEEDFGLDHRSAQTSKHELAF